MGSNKALSMQNSNTIEPCLTKEKIEIQIEPWEICGFEQ